MTARIAHTIVRHTLKVGGVVCALLLVATSLTVMAVFIGQGLGIWAWRQVLGISRYDQLNGLPGHGSAISLQMIADRFNDVPRSPV